MKARNLSIALLSAGLIAGVAALPAFADVVPSKGKPAPVAAPADPAQIGSLGEHGPTSLATAAIERFRTIHPGTQILWDGDQIARVYGKAFSTGSTPVASADAFVNEHAGVFGVNPADLLPIGPFEDGAHLQPIMFDRETGTYKFTGVYYMQTVQDIPVFRGGLIVLCRNEAGFPAVLASSTLWDSAALAQAVAGRNVRALPSFSVYTRKALNFFNSQAEVMPAQYVIWAGVDREAAVAPRLAVTFEAEGGNAMLPNSYQRMLFVVDAANGDILYQENLVYEAISGQLKLNATQGTAADVCAPVAAVGMPYGEIVQGGSTYYADVNGNFSIPTVGNLSYTTRVAGKYFTVSDNGAAPMSITATVNSGDTWVPLLNSANASEDDRAEVNAYLAANKVRDMVLVSNPAYPTVSTQAASFAINVNIASTCNANWSGNTINFFHSGGGCNNTGFGTVVHHEYGHNVVSKGGSGQGAYGEGMGDVLAVLMTDSSFLGVGFQSCGSALRNANNSCQYSASNCSSCGSEAHSCGMLISGCIWNMRTNLAGIYADYLQRTADLAINSVLLHGAISTIAADIPIDYLTLDDDNADISDGTPNYNSIAAAFAAHSMPVPTLAPLKFIFPSGIPSVASPAGTTQVPFTVQGLSGIPVAGTGKAFVKMPGAGSYTEVPLASGGVNSYVLTIPSAACGGVASYYFSAQAQGGATQTSPATAPSSVHSSILAYNVSTIVDDQFETASGWIGGLAGDTATSGTWVREDPVGTAAQPEDDHTPVPGTICWVTGNAAAGAAIGTNDVDGGYTTLLSPTYSMLGQSGAFVSYWRWYSNDQGSAPNADTFPIEVSNNNGATWVTMESVTENANAWVFKQFRVNDFVTPTAQVRFRFRAQDLGSGSLVEAAIDDFKVVFADCNPPITPDLNHDGIVDGADLGILLGSWGTGTADLNGDGTTDGADLGILLGSWTI